MKVETEPKPSIASDLVEEVLLPDGQWWQVEPGTFAVHSPNGAKNPAGAYFLFEILGSAGRIVEAPLGSLRAYTYAKPVEDEEALVIPSQSE